MVLHAYEIRARRRRRTWRGLMLSGVAVGGLAGLWVLSSQYAIEIGVPAWGGMLKCRTGAVSVWVNCDVPGGPGFSIPYRPYRSSRLVDLDFSRIAAWERSWLAPRMWRYRTNMLSQVGTSEEYAIAIWLVMIPFVALLLWFVRLVLRLPSRVDERCVVCNYNLSDNVSGVCPECGTPFREKHEVQL